MYLGVFVSDFLSFVSTFYLPKYLSFVVMRNCSKTHLVKVLGFEK